MRSARAFRCGPDTSSTIEVDGKKRRYNPGQPRAVKAGTERVVGTSGNQAEGSQTATDVLPGEQGIGVIEHRTGRSR